ncbi:MAG TPA: RNA polymerase sigma factor [Chitinophagaceae bacterium]|nr:RNA polymerase sigma factor [Chitinophagaceae bacterium]
MSVNEFNQVLVRHSDFLRPFAISLTRDTDAARDLMQETMYRALANKDKYNAGTNIKAWLYTILRNTFINNYRRKIKQNDLFRHTPAEYLTESGISPFSSDGRLREKEAWTRIMELPQLFRNPFVLYFEGYKYHEIAELYKEPLGTIKSRIHFARKLLKTQLER